MDISVIIPAKNSERTMGKCLRSVFTQTFKPFDVIVVDGGSTDRTQNIAKELGAKVFLEPEHIGSVPGIGRNYGAKHTKGDVLAFLDSDCYPEKTWLSKVSKILSNPKVGIYGIIVDVTREEPIASQAFHYLHKQINYDFVPSRCMAIRKELFWKVGGFDEKLPTGEDNDLSYRIKEQGYELVIDKKSEVYHDDEHMKTLLGIWHLQKWYASTEREMRDKYPERFRRLKTTRPLNEHLLPVIKSIKYGLKFSVTCIIIKGLSAWRHLI
ncbi:MAG: glycosyltransferase [Candidatus Freyarchaeum deiterrae]